MANIREYTNPVDKLTPTDLGFTARETAARRIGPLAKETAADIEKSGRLQGELFSQAEKDQALAIKALDESTARGGGSGRGGGSSGGSGIIGGGGSHGGGGGGYARPDPQWADTANQVTYTALALSSHDHGTLDADGLYHEGKLLSPGDGKSDLYSTGQYNSVPTASGSYSNQGYDNVSGGGDMTPAQIAADLKQGDALFKRDWEGRTILDSNYKPTDRLYQPITSPGSDTTINGVTLNGPGSGASSGFLAQTWDQISGLASRGYSAITGGDSKAADTGGM